MGYIGGGHTAVDDDAVGRADWGGEAGAGSHDISHLHYGPNTL
jgi:hypothetical protein